MGRGETGVKPSDRHDWIESYLAAQPTSRGVDVLDQAFVNAYIEATSARHTVQPYGAPTCPQLGRDLATMANDLILTRARAGVEGMRGMGFPSWVWRYELHPAFRKI